MTLWAGNLVYMYLSISFIQMLKAFTPVITLACGVVAGLEHFNRHKAASVALITLGTAVAAYGEGTLTAAGLTLNTIGAVSESLRLVMTQVGAGGGPSRRGPAGLAKHAVRKKRGRSSSLADLCVPHVWPRARRSGC